jgi:hypothetical protein
MKNNNVYIYIKIFGWLMVQVARDDIGVVEEIKH